MTDHDVEYEGEMLDTTYKHEGHAGNDLPGHSVGNDVFGSGNMNVNDEKGYHHDDTVTTPPDQVTPTITSAEDIKEEKMVDMSENGFGKGHMEVESPPPAHMASDIFGDETDHDIKYKVLSWPMLSVLMIAEIVSNGMLSLPSSLAVVGIVPGVILIVFLGALALWTALLLIRFKLNHPEVHNMGDAGYIMFGWPGREILSMGSVLFAIAATGSQFLAGQIALGVISENAICSIYFQLVFAVPTIFISLFRKFSHLAWLSVGACISILAAGIVGMVGAGITSSIQPIDIALSQSFVVAFQSISNPVFAYAGHFLFFALITEMKNPKDAYKAAWVLQIFATSFYVVFAVVLYLYVGSSVASPALSSLPPIWAKVSFGIALLNFLIAACIYMHVAAKILFVRIFRKSHHLYSNTLLGWSVWALLVLLATSASFVLAIGVSIFNYIVGLTASAFASWYTYGIAGLFWLYDAYHAVEPGMVGGFEEYRRHPIMTTCCVLVFLVGLIICVGGLYSTIVSLIEAYASGLIGGAFVCQ